MYGFIISRKHEPAATGLGTAKRLSCNGVFFVYNPMNKFENDKLFYEDAEKILLLDGVVFNKKELMEQYPASQWQDTVDRLYGQLGNTFQNVLRGSFCGAVLEKASDTLTLFTNHSGEKTVYYYHQNAHFAAASHNALLQECLAEQGITLQPDVEAHRQLMATGSILHGKTPFLHVRRLNAGKMLVVHGEQSQESRYHMFHNVPEHALTLGECVEELDRRFRKAVDRIFSKNVEYGYEAECDLSGGLDCRMTAWVAHALGYKMTNVCYCQSGNIDHQSSKKMAAAMGNDYLFLPMDDGELLMDIDEVVGKFGGQVTYVVCTGANRALKRLPMDKIGLCATGLLGELPNAYWTEGYTHTPARYTPNRYSSVSPGSLVPYEVPESYSEGYDNFEQMNLYEYSALLFLTSALVRQQEAEVTSPFIDVDYLEFAYRIPLKWRKDYLLTMTWMVNKYPQAAKFVWQTKRMPVDKAYYHKFYFPKFWDDLRNRVVHGINLAANLVHLPIRITYKNEMNPFDLWYTTNPRLRAFLENYFRENIHRIQDDAFRADVEKTFQKGKAIDKLQAITVLGVYKNYF